MNESEFLARSEAILDHLESQADDWAAARTGGFHYRFDGQKWVDTRGGPDMADTLSQICSEISGKPIKVTV